MALNESDAPQPAGVAARFVIGHLFRVQLGGESALAGELDAAVLACWRGAAS